MEIRTNEPIDAKSILTFQARKEIKNLWRRFIEEVEDIKHHHESMLKKLEKEIPTQYHSLLRAAFFFDEGEYAFRRKRVLDIGNDAERKVSDEIGKFNIQFLRNKE